MVPLSQSVARFNRAVTNHVTRLVAPWLPGFGVVTHVGRRSGRQYETPVNVFLRPGGYVVALTYGRGDWVRNVLAAGSARLRTRGRIHCVANPRVIVDRTGAAVPRPVRWLLGRMSVTEFLFVDAVNAT
jgi:deazaflavin-dependent oxidoreductase (nitroreductase family)